MGQYEEIKATIVRSGRTMKDVLSELSRRHHWSDNVTNLTNKLKRESLRYREAIELADVLGYDIVWEKRDR